MDAKPEIKDPENYDFSRIKVGLQQLDDAILDLGSLKKSNKQYSDKATVMRALAKKDYTTLRAISNYFYEMSGIYEKTSMLYLPDFCDNGGTVQICCAASVI